MRNISTDSYSKRLEKQKALFEAAETGDTEKISNLFSLGISVDAVDFKREKYYAFKHALTPLHIAASNGHLECVQLLIDHGANLNATDEYNSTALHKAAEKGNYLCLKALLEAGSDSCLPIVCKSSSILSSPYLGGTTALHLAAKNNHVNCVKELISFGADYNAVDVNGHTSLYIAAEAGLEECVLAHLRHPRGIDILSLPSYDTSNTPLHFAVEYRMLECVKDLVLLGSDVNHINKDGFSPLHLLYCNVSKENFVEEQILKHLVLGGSSVDINDLLSHVIYKNQEMAKFLITCGADINIIGTKSLLRREICANEDIDFLKFVVKCLPVLPHLKSLKLCNSSVSDIFPKDISNWDGSVLSDNAEFNLVLDETDIAIEIFEREAGFRYVRYKPILKYSRYPVKEPLLGLVYNRVIEELKYLDCRLKPNIPVRTGLLNMFLLLKLKKQLWYEQKASKPFTLQHYCRYTIRKNIDFPNVKQISKLPLPKQLLPYLLFECDE